MLAAMTSDKVVPLLMLWSSVVKIYAVCNNEETIAILGVVELSTGDSSKLSRIDRVTFESRVFTIKQLLPNNLFLEAVFDSKTTII